MSLMLTEAPSIGLVVCLGVGMVFVGLICIIAICYLLGAIIRVFEKNKPTPQEKSVQAASSASAPAVIENRQEFIAAVSAALAEELGKDVSAIRIKSIKKL